MKLFTIELDRPGQWDVCDGFAILAESKEMAIEIAIDNARRIEYMFDETNDPDKWRNHSVIEEVPLTETRCVLASFKAG